MDTNKFVETLAEIIPSSDEKTSLEWAKICSAFWDEDGDPLADCVSQLTHIAAFFDDNVAQMVYDLAKFGHSVGPFKFLTAAVLLADGVSPNHIVNHSECLGYAEVEKNFLGEVKSPLALVTIIENGEETTYPSFHYGAFEPHSALAASIEYTWGKDCSVGDVLRLMTTDYNPKKIAPNHIISLKSNERLILAMKSIWGRYRAISAHITFNLDKGPGVCTEVNPNI